MSSYDKPEQAKLTAEEADALKQRLAASNLTESDKKLMTGLIAFSLWLQRQLETAKLSIRRLKKLFGTSTEKKSLKKV